MTKRATKPKTANFWLKRVAEGNILQSIQQNKCSAVKFFGPLAVMRACPSELANLAVAIRISRMSDEEVDRMVKATDLKARAAAQTMREQTKTLDERELQNVIIAMKTTLKRGKDLFVNDGFVDSHFLALLYAGLATGAQSPSNALIGAMRKQAHRIIQQAKG